MIYCGNCGARNDDDAVICGECGKKIHEAEEITESVEKTESKRDKFFSTLSKFRYLILNCIVLAASILVIINGFVGNFKIRVYYLSDYDINGEAVYDHIDVNQNLYKAVDSVVAYIKGEYNVRNNNGDYNYQGDVYTEFFELNDRLNMIVASVGPFYGTPTKAQKKKLSKEFGKVNMVKYFLIADDIHGSNDRSGFFCRGIDFSSVMMMLALPVSLASALVSTIFAILAAVNISRKREGKFNTVLSVPFILIGVTACILSIGFCIPGGLTVAAVVLLLLCAAAVAVISILTGKTFNVRKVVLYGVTFAVSFIIILLNSFFGSAYKTVALKQFEGFRSNLLMPVVFGLSCGVWSGSFAGLMGYDRRKKIKSLSIADVVLASCGMLSSFIGREITVFLISVVSDMLAVGLLIFIGVFKTDTNTAIEKQE